jgi:hypothetical protein
VEVGRVERSYLEQNAAGLQRLRNVAQRISDDQLAQELDGGWTIATVFAHLTFWDRYLVARWNLATHEGQREPAQIAEFVAGLINTASLEGWLACPPRIAVQQALAAAERAERFIADLEPERAAAALAGGRPSLVDRSLHWFQHIDQIEAVLRR